MKVLLLLAVVILAFGPTQVHGNILKFGLMILRKTGKIPFYSYNNYGCYCGLGGTGSPKDATDWCCAAHDCCYARLEKHGCALYYPSYQFSFQGDEIICAANQDFCLKELCQCDKAAAECFAWNLNTYNNEYRSYNKSLCLGRHPALEVFCNTPPRFKQVLKVYEKRKPKNKNPGGKVGAHLSSPKSWWVRLIFPAPPLHYPGPTEFPSPPSLSHQLPALKYK